MILRLGKLPRAKATGGASGGRAIYPPSNGEPGPVTAAGAATAEAGDAAGAGRMGPAAVATQSAG